MFILVSFSFRFCMLHVACVLLGMLMLNAPSGSRQKAESESWTFRYKIQNVLLLLPAVLDLDQSDTGRTRILWFCY
jgi:hypothetical protein